MTSATTQQIMAAAVHSYCQSQPTTHNSSQFLQPPSIVDNLDNENRISGPVARTIVKDGSDTPWIEGVSLTEANMTSTGCGGTAISTANTTQYFPIAGDIQAITTVEADVQFKIRKAGTLLKLGVRISSYSVAGSATFTLRKNGSDTGITFTISAVGYHEDLINSVHVDPGDLLNLKGVPNAATGTYTLKTIQIHFIADDGSTTCLLGCTQNNNIALSSSTRYFPIHGRFANTSVENNTKSRQRIAGTYANYGVYVSANARTTSTTFKSRKNGADGNMSVTFAAGETGWKEDLVNSDIVAVDDDYNFTVTTGSGTETMTTSAQKVEFTNQVFRGIFSSGNTGSSNVQNANTTNDYPLKGPTIPLGVISYPYKVRNYRLILSELHVRVDANTVTADSTATLMVNGIDTGLTCTITASTNGVFSDLTNKVQVSFNDDLTVKIVTGATGTSMAIPSIQVYYHTRRITKEFKLPYRILQRVGGRSIKFDGVNDRLNCGNHSDLWSQSLTKFSMSFWMRPEIFDDGTNFRDIVNHGVGASCFKYQFRPNNPNTKWVIIDSGAAEQIAAFHISTPTFRWYFVILTYDNSLGSANIKYFLDNVQVAFRNFTEAINTSNDLRISENTTDLKGNFKDFRWWTTKALDATERTNVMNNDPAAPTPDYWLKMDENTGNPIDSIGGKTATLENGAAWDNTTAAPFASTQFRFPYNIKQRISKQFRFVYNIVQRISKQFRFPYNIKQRVSKIFRYPYNVVGRISKQFRFPYNIKQRISKQFRFLYNITTRISKQFRFPYNIQQIISKTFRFPYNVIQRTSKQFRFPYNIVARISKQFRFPYNIKQRVSKQFRYPYNIVARISKQFRYPYNIKQRISKQFQFPYNIKQRISKQFTFLYNILSEGIRVSKTFQFPYNIVGRTSKQFRFPYNITVRISKQFRFLYNIRQRISKQFIFLYNIKSRVIKTFRFPYNIQQRISKQFRFPYNVKQRISKTFRFPYNILSELIRVSKTFRFPYNITVRVSRTFRFPYNIARPIRRITHEAGAFGVRLKIPTRGIAKMLWDRIHDGFDE